MAAKVTRDTIYVRVPSKHKNQLAKYAQALDVTQNQIVENLIAYFMSLPGEVRGDIVHGKSLSLHSESNIGTALECLAWSEHAFVRGHYEWSLEGWRYLQSIAERSDSVGLERLAHYKQTLCWNKIAWGLRDESLDQAAARLSGREGGELHDGPLPGASEGDTEQWNSAFAAADKAICAGIEHNDMFNELSKHYYHPVIVYNTSCQHSLRAQFLAERLALIKPEHWGRLLEFKKEAQKSRSTAIDRDEALWSKLGKEWANGIDDEHVLRIRGYANSSIGGLKTIIKTGGTGEHGKPAPVSDESFLLRYAGSDRDLLFVRSDPVISQFYKGIFTGYKPKTRLETFTKLWEKESQAVRGRVEPRPQSATGRTKRSKEARE